MDLSSPKGTQDRYGEECELINFLFSVIREEFRLHGAQELQTPVFEKEEILMGKYGEDEKLIFKLKKQGGTPYVLRYDHSVPFARYVAKNNLSFFTRFAIGQVYRRDNPSVAQGRMREFYQADIDYAGDYATMVPESELLSIIYNVFHKIGIKDCVIQVSHRSILDGTFEICGVKEGDIRSVSSSIDKLDKTPWNEVEKELLETKNIDPEVVGKLKNLYGTNFSSYNVGEFEKIIYKNIGLEKSGAMKKVKHGLDSLKELSEILKIIEPSMNILWNLSLARGLDYYTGLIYEVICPKHRDVGSISGGGRFDNLVNMFAKTRQIPCVGGSFGVDRIVAILRRIQEAKSTNNVVAYVTMPTDNGTSKLYAIEVADKLRKRDIPTLLNMKRKFNLSSEIKWAAEKGIKYLIIVGEEEEKNDEINVRNLTTRETTKMKIENFK